jgi:hypothetical protein
VSPTRGQHGTEAPRGVGEGLTRHTFNLTPRADSALRRLADASGDSRTAVIGNALRLAATLQDLAHADGSVHVVAPDGTLHIVHPP